MALFSNNEAQREVEVLARIEKRIERREKRERVYRMIIAGLSVMALASLALNAGLCRSKKSRRSK